MDDDGIRARFDDSVRVELLLDARAVPASRKERIRSIAHALGYELLTVETTGFAFGAVGDVFGTTGTAAVRFVFGRVEAPDARRRRERTLARLRAGGPVLPSLGEAPPPPPQPPPPARPPARGPGPARASCLPARRRLPRWPGRANAAPVSRRCRSSPLPFASPASPSPGRRAGARYRAAGRRPLTGRDGAGAAARPRRPGSRPRGAGCRSVSGT
ncbi:hypothetical protein [Streptomyces omiyaensis]|uniref:Uncharacterized protein n=1 Tax=Streptomyces omiyaensis TaxID=68247 RepID=A0ABW7C4G0_9ACTN